MILDILCLEHPVELPETDDRQIQVIGTGLQVSGYTFAIGWYRPRKIEAGLTQNLYTGLTQAPS